MLPAVEIQADPGSLDDFYCQMMCKICSYNSLHGFLMYALGHGELWMDWDSTSKLSQYGWRCTNQWKWLASKNPYGQLDWRAIQYPKNCAAQDASFPGMSLCFSLLWI